MSATKLAALAAGIKTAIDAAAIGLDGNPLRVYTYEGRGHDSLPAVTIDGPTAFQRRGADDPDSQLGAMDWRAQFTLRIYTPLDDPEKAAADSRAVLGQVVAAIDADPSLNGAAEIDAVIANGEMNLTPEDAQRQMVVYECDLHAWALVT